MSDEKRRASLWAATADTGVSSKAIMNVMLGGKPEGWWCFPRDSSDFGRCFRLLEAVPEWRARMGEMAKIGPEWAALVDRWSAFEMLYTAKHHNELSRLMLSIIRPLEDKRPGLVRFGNMTIYTGGEISQVTIHDRALAMADKHRSWLERAELVGDGTCVWNGLNPSTAGVEVNDPTITREIGFTRRLGCRQMIKLNLFTGRATKPENLWKIEDPVGPDADGALERALAMLGGPNDRFIAAWGTRPNGGPLWFKEMYAMRVRHTLRMAQACGVQPWCLGFTDDASPRHPLYVRADAPLVPFVYGGQL